MHKQKIKELIISTIIFLMSSVSMLSCSSDERFATGVVREISQESIKLNLATGMISSIGFTCEPKVCESTRQINIGDEVFITLGDVNGVNKLLSIRKCQKQDKDCFKAKESVILQEIESQKTSQQFMDEYKKCGADMREEIAEEKRHIFVNKTYSMNKSSEEIIQRYNRLIKEPVNKECLENIVNSHKEALLESCLKHDCGKNIGGGCYHIVGNSITASILEAAIENCGI